MRALGMGIVAVVFAAVAATARVVPVDPRLVDWMFLEDIPPFAHSDLTMRFDKGGGGPYYGGRFFGEEDAENVMAATLYRDQSRNMVVSVDIRRQAQGRYVAHMVESGFRSEFRDDGRFGPKGQMLQLPWGVVYYFCEQAPDCVARTYLWLSGNDTGVEVGATCGVWGPDATGDRVYSPLPCPEPTEILEAYLTRYPSSLSYYVDSNSQALRWWTKRAELKMAAARYQLDRAVDGSSADRLLAGFARIRAKWLGGPAARPQELRIAALAKLPPAAKREQLNAIWDEYHIWWVANQGAPVDLYVEPTPTPVTTPATPATTPATPDPTP